MIVKFLSKIYNIQLKYIEFLIRVIRSILAYLIIGIVCTVLFPICVFISLLPEKYRHDNRVFFFCTDMFFKTVMFAMMVPVKITGKHNLPKGPSIFVANHQSSADIPVLGSLLNRYSSVWLVSAFYERHPIIGCLVRRMNVPVDKNCPRKSASSLAKIIKFVQNKNRHLIIFPEGRRYIDGEIHSFYEGFAVAAKKLNRPVVPVLIRNLNKIFPPDSILVGYEKLEIVIGKPFEYNIENSTEEFKDKVHEWFVENMKK